MTAWYVRNVFHVYIMTINLMSSLESISPSRSMREDSTSFAGQTPLTESGERD